MDAFHQILVDHHNVFYWFLYRVEVITHFLEKNNRFFVIGW